MATQTNHKVSDACKSLVIENLKQLLFRQYGVEDKDIPLYLRGLRLHNDGRPLGEVFLPKGKISFEDFDKKQQMLKDGSEKLFIEIHEETKKVKLFDNLLVKEVFICDGDKDRITSNKANSERILATHYNTLAGYDLQVYDLYNKHPIDAKKFYADIAPLLNELNDLLQNQAHARRNGEP